MRQKDQHNTALTDKAILICDYLLMVGKVQIRQISNGEGRDPQCVNFRQVPSRKNVESGLPSRFQNRIRVFWSPDPLECVAHPSQLRNVWNS